MAWEANISQIFPFLQKRAAEIIQADQEIISAFSNEEAGKRYWEIAGFARVPCGSTHLKNTSEIGTIRMKRKNPGKGKERIEIYVDDLSP